MPERRPVTAQEVNTFLADVSGTDISAKDFRTFRASAEAVGALVEGEASEGTNEKKALISAADHVSKALANTSAVARSSYIHPNVFKAFESRKLKSSLSKNQLVQGLSRFESALLRLLRSNAG